MKKLYEEKDVLIIVREFIDDFLEAFKETTPENEIKKELKDELVSIVEEIKDNDDEDFIGYFEEILEKNK